MIIKLTKRQKTMILKNSIKFHIFDLIPDIEKDILQNEEEREAMVSIHTKQFIEICNRIKNLDFLENLHYPKNKKMTSLKFYDEENVYEWFEFKLKNNMNVNISHSKYPLDEGNPLIIIIDSTEEISQTWKQLFVEELENELKYKVQIVK